MPLQFAYNIEHERRAFKMARRCGYVPKRRSDGYALVDRYRNTIATELTAQEMIRLCYRAIVEREHKAAQG